MQRPQQHWRRAAPLGPLLPVLAGLAVAEQWAEAAAAPDRGGDGGSHSAPTAAAQQDRGRSGSGSQSASAEADGAASGAPRPARLVAVGDLHGDLPQAVAALSFAGVVAVAAATAAARGAAADRAHWAGGEAVLVQVGDLIDRGPDSEGVVRLLERLRGEARSAGGDVITLMGNHELLALQGVTHFTHEEEVKRYGGPAKRNAHFGPSGAVGRLLAGFPLAYRWGDTAFVHAGLSPEEAALGVEGLNAAAAAAVAARNWEAPVLAHRGPLWSREQLRAAERGECSMLAGALTALGAAEGAPVTRLVVGHTVRRDGRISVLCGGGLLAIDTGISNWTEGRIGAVELRRPPGSRAPSEVTLLQAPAPPPGAAQSAGHRRRHRRILSDAARMRREEEERSQSVLLVPFLATVVMPLMLAAGAAGFTCAARGLRRGLLRLRPKPAPAPAAAATSPPPAATKPKEQAAAVVRSRSGEGAAGTPITPQL